MAHCLRIAKELYEKVNVSAKEELKTFKRRRVAAFRKGLIHYTTCQIRQAKEQYALYKELLSLAKELAE